MWDEKWLDQQREREEISAQFRQLEAEHEKEIKEYQDENERFFVNWQTAEAFIDSIKQWEEYMTFVFDRREK